MLAEDDDPGFGEAPMPTYKILNFSLYHSTISLLDRLVERDRLAGLHASNRSSIVRRALEAYARRDVAAETGTARLADPAPGRGRCPACNATVRVRQSDGTLRPHSPGMAGVSHARALPRCDGSERPPVASARQEIS